MNLIQIVLLLIMLSGCAPPHRVVNYAPEQEITTSLFKSDINQISNESATKILEGKITLPSNARVALLKISNKTLGIKYYGYSYWKSEDYMDLKQRYVDILSSKVLIADKVKNVVVLPSFITGENLTLSQMREASVRLQAHLLVIYSLKSDIFEKFKLFEKNQVKAFASCEVAVLDTKTGIIPFTKIITEKHLTLESKSDLNISETRRRAEVQVSEQCLHKLGDSIFKHFNTM
jgi:hypothetical protein